MNSDRNNKNIQNLKELDFTENSKKKSDVSNRAQSVDSSKFSIPITSKNNIELENIKNHNNTYSDNERFNQSNKQKSGCLTLPLINNQNSLSYFSTKHEPSSVDLKRDTNYSFGENKIKKSLTPAVENSNRPRSNLRRNSMTSIKPEIYTNKKDFHGSMTNISSNEITLPTIKKVNEPKRIENNYIKNTESSLNRNKRAKLFHRIFK